MRACNAHRRKCTESISSWTNSRILQAWFGNCAVSIAGLLPASAPASGQKQAVLVSPSTVCYSQVKSRVGLPHDHQCKHHQRLIKQFVSANLCYCLRVSQPSQDAGKLGVMIYMLRCLNRLLDWPSIRYTYSIKKSSSLSLIHI